VKEKKDAILLDDAVEQSELLVDSHNGGIVNSGDAQRHHMRRHGNHISGLHQATQRSLDKGNQLIVSMALVQFNPKTGEQLGVGINQTQAAGLLQRSDHGGA
jgi:hypothetical protein